MFRLNLINTKVRARNVHVNNAKISKKVVGKKVGKLLGNNFFRALRLNNTSIVVKFTFSFAKFLCLPILW